MKKTNKLWLALLLTVLVAALLAVGFTAAAVETPGILAQGYCGGEGDRTNLTWVLTDDCTLTISGTGAMADFRWDQQPWSEYNSAYHNAYNNPVIQSVVIEEGVTTIGDCAFYFLDLDSLVLPSGITEIGCDVFSGSLPAVTLPDSLELICPGAFNGAVGLRDVYYTGSEAQWNQISIASNNNENLLDNPNLTIHYNVADWGYCGGEGDGTNVTWVLDNDGTLTINGSGYIRHGAFQGRTDVKNVVFLDGTDHIGANMFAGCSNLESITIPYTSMEEIEVTSVADCDSLSVICYDGTPAQWDLMAVYYNEEVFGGSYAEYAQTMRAYIKSLVQFADTDWGYCGGEGDGTNLMWELSTDYTLTISGTGEMANYTSYQNRTTAPWGPYYLRLKTVVLQPGVTSIGDSAFYDCTALESVTIPDGVLSLGNNSFVGCFALTSITIPDSVTSIPNAFASCIALTSVMIPDSVTNIDAGAFSYCIALQDVYYGGSEAQWNDITIAENHTPLENATIHFNVVDWGYCGAAGNEESLTWVFTNDGTLTISGTGPMGAFRQNGHYVMIGVVGPTAKRVRKVVVEEGVTSLPEQAFIGVDRYLEEVILPASLETIGAWAFYHLEGLRSGTIPENSQLTTIGSAAFSGDSSLTSFRIPEGVTTIENGAFYQVPLTELTIPGSVTTIGNAAFDGGYSDEQAVFTTVTIPATVTSIGSNAFRKAVVIYGYAGSAAEAFAAENGNVFIALCPTEHQNAYEVPATEATEAAHGYTAGVFCPDCETWLSGHDVIHNALGEQRVIKEPTETEEGIVDIRCTVCGEWGRYTADPTGSQPDDNSGGFWAQIQSFFRGIIDWFLRLFKWLG